MRGHASTAEREPVHTRTSRSARRRRPGAEAVPRETLRRDVADDISRFLAEGHAITLVPIGATAFDHAGRRGRMPFPAMEWDD